MRCVSPDELGGVQRLGKRIRKEGSQAFGHLHRRRKARYAANHLRHAIRLAKATTEENENAKRYAAGFTLVHDDTGARPPHSTQSRETPAPLPGLRGIPAPGRRMAHNRGTHQKERNNVEDENMPAAQPGALTADAVADAVYRAVRRCATHLRPDVLAAMQAAREDETQPRAQSVLDCLLENARIGQEDDVPICQDTGTCWVRLEVGEELLIPGNILSGVNDAVARAYTDGRLRMSVVADALLDRTNTGDNTPAFAEIALRPGHGATLHVLLKGGGSDNASRVVMLAPGAGWEGVKKVVLDCVREKAANACPPLIVGVGVGATFDKVAGLAKHALLREVGTPAASPQAAKREAELLSAINATGIGPAALGGGATALAVHLETAPCHIAALPVAVNMGCSAMRSASIELIDWGEGK